MQNIRVVHSNPVVNVMLIIVGLVLMACCCGGMIFLFV